MEAEQNGATSFDTAVKRKASYHYEGQTLRLTRSRDAYKTVPSVQSILILTAFTRVADNSS